jgi:hypothetical protein
MATKTDKTRAKKAYEEAVRIRSVPLPNYFVMKRYVETNELTNPPSKDVQYVVKEFATKEKLAEYVKTEGISGINQIGSMGHGIFITKRLESKLDLSISE